MKKILSFLMMSLIIFAVSCKKDKGPQTVAVTGVKVTPAAVSLTPHSEHTFTVEVYPVDATNKAVTWDYDDSVVEMVEGKENAFYVPDYQDEPIVLTVTTVDGGFTDEAVISVAHPVNPTGITLSEPVAMKVGETQTLSYTITPADACQCEEEIMWNYEPYRSASDPDCVIIMDEATGEITAINPGTATVTVETLNGYTAQKTITVTASDLVAVSNWTWAGGKVNLSAPSEVESYELTYPDYLQIEKGKLECTSEGELTLPLFLNKGMAEISDGYVRVKANLKNGQTAYNVIVSQAWKPAFFDNKSLQTPAVSFKPGEIYLAIYDSELSFLTYGESLWVEVTYPDGSGVGNYFPRPDSYGLYRTHQIKTGEFNNYKVAVGYGDVVYEFDLTPNN
jgi:uncharacterized protein YjdB